MKIKKRDGSILEAGFEEELGKNAFRHTAAHILAFTMISIFLFAFRKKTLRRLRQK